MTRNSKNNHFTLSRTPKLSGSGVATAVIFFVLQVWSVTSAQLQAEEPTGWANVTGRVVVDGDVPEIPTERVGAHKDRAVCLVEGEIPADDQLVVGDQGGLRDVFIILTAPDSGTRIPIHPSYLRKVEASLTLDNLKCRFQPHAMAVMIGQPILLKNSDSVGHNCKIASMNNEHNVNLPVGGQATIKLDSEDRVPANVTCDIHPWMDALVLAKEHPYVAITKTDGSFEMKNVPAGNWKLQFWHQRFGYLRKLEVPGFKVDRRGRIEIQLSESQPLDLGSMDLPADAIR